MSFIKIIRSTALFISLLLFLFSCSNAKENTKTLEVSAASSLTDVLTEIIGNYEKETGIPVEINYGSSSMCARQIKEGKSSSIFLSANELWMEYLQDLYIRGTDRVLLNNTLVLVVPSASENKITKLTDLLNENIDRIAMGDPGYVPVGIYGREFLEKQQLWDRLENKIVGSYDARAALSLIESDSVDCGIIYRTDALSSKKVKILFDLPMGNRQINYFVTRFDDSEETHHFYDYLFNSYSRSIFEKYGFLTREKV